MDPLATVLLAGAISISHGENNMRENALKSLGKYSYKTYGIEKQVKDFEKKTLPDEFKQFGGFGVAIYTVVVRKRVEFVWTF